MAWSIAASSNGINRCVMCWRVSSRASPFARVCGSLEPFLRPAPCLLPPRMHYFNAPSTVSPFDSEIKEFGHLASGPRLRVLMTRCARFCAPGPHGNWRPQGSKAGWSTGLQDRRPTLRIHESSEVPDIGLDHQSPHGRVGRPLCAEKPAQAETPGVRDRERVVHGIMKLAWGESRNQKRVEPVERRRGIVCQVAVSVVEHLAAGIDDRRDREPELRPQVVEEQDSAADLRRSQVKGTAVLPQEVFARAVEPRVLIS
jgi:hypothetical protein